MKRPEGNLDLFGGGSTRGDAPENPDGARSGEDGSTPIPPLQISVKMIRIERIEMSQADDYLIRVHYLHRTAKNSKIAFGFFCSDALRGAAIWGLPVAKIKGQFGKSWTQLELRRMFCDPSLPKNSESRCLAVMAGILHKLFPQCKQLVAYSDLSRGHRGGIYKAAGWAFMGRIEADKDGGWSKHPRHNRVETGDKFKWIKPLT